MDSDGRTSALENVGTFRKPSNDAAGRKYRRRSPVGGGSSSDDTGSPARERSVSPIWHRKDREKNGDFRQRKDDERDLHRHTDRKSSRSNLSHYRNEEYTTHSKNGDNDERDHSKSYSYHHRDSRGRDYSDHSRQENDHRLRDYPRDADKYSREKYVGRSGERDRHKEYRDSRDEKTDRKRNLGEYKSDHSHAYKEYRGRHNESTLEKDDEKYTKVDKKKYDEGDKERQNREKYEKYEDRKFSSSRSQASPAKRSKFSSFDDGSTDHGKDVSKPIMADEKQSSNSKQGQVPTGEVNLEQGVSESDIDAAKVAAMKAAELVNKNLIGTGYMTTDQKKKLLWGSKKSTNTTEESAHCWDTSTFGDSERQEKFKKLMGVKGEIKPDMNDAEKQKELQMELEKQYTAGLRRRDGRTVGLGL